MKEAEIFAGFSEAATRVFAARKDDYDPWFFRYFSDLQSPAGRDKFVRYEMGKLRFARVEVSGLSVLDVGCGFGMALVLCGVLGAKELYGIDLYDGMVRTVQSYRDLLPRAIGEKLSVSRADAASIPFESNRFDLVLASEAISHYLNVEASLKEVCRVVKPGGVLLITDGNNGRNPRIRRSTVELWEAFERGEAGQHVHGHLVETPFVVKRERLVREALPGSSDDVVAEIVRGTSGMTKEGIGKACAEFKSTGRRPSSYYERGDLPVDPEKGDVIERLFDPYSLGRDIEALGLRARVCGYWGGASGRLYLRLANAALSALGPLSMSTAGEFRIAATKCT